MFRHASQGVTVRNFWLCTTTTPTATTTTKTTTTRGSSATVTAATKWHLGLVCGHNGHVLHQALNRAERHYVGRSTVSFQ